jgi:hypothetical protein
MRCVEGGMLKGRPSGTDPFLVSEAEAARLEHAAPRIGSPRHFRWLGGVAKSILVLNLLDAVFTTAWVSAGLAREANPLLAELVTSHPVAFVLVKTTLVGLGSLLLWRKRTRPLAVVGIFAVFLVYYAILLYHLGFASWIAGELLSSR